MDPENTRNPTRGRARARTRPHVPQQPPTEPVTAGTIPPQGSGGVEQMEVAGAPSMEVYEHMFAGEEGSGNGSGSGSGHEGDGSGSAGRGSVSPSTSDQRASPRGGTPRSIGGKSGEFAMPDYVRSRPEDFEKKGTAGTTTGPTTNVIANYYVLKTHPEFQMSLYTVRVEPEPDAERIIRGLVATRKVDIASSYLLSGTQLFITRPILRDDLTTFNASLPDNPDAVYQVTLTFQRVVGPGEGLVLQFYNIMVRRMQVMMQYQLLGRHYFDQAQKVEFRNWRLELWPGFANSIRQQETSLMLNVESCWKVLQTENILQKMTEIRNQNQGNFQAACNEAIIGMLIITKYNSRAYKISRIDFNTNPTHTFERRNGPPITYMDYYMERHQVSIQVSTQPMLVSEPTARDIRRGQVHDIYLVPELCFPCGLNDELRGNFRLMKDLATHLHMAPGERVNTMQRFINRVRGNPELMEALRAWNVQVTPSPVEVPARMLPIQDIVCGNNHKIRPDDKADWTRAFIGQRMLSSMSLKQWAIVVTARDAQQVGNLISTMQRVAGPLGYQISQPQTIIRINDNRGPSYVRGVDDAMNQLQRKIDLLFIVLANNNADTYASVKKRCSIDFGIPSQCFLAKNLSNKGLMSICTKMVIQMNAKQGGEPWSVVVPLKELMVLGYDVHHAGPAGGNSIGAMTTTLTATLGKCFSTVARVNNREEVATTVAGMFEKCLNAYYEHNHAYPQRIMMYRDGVGEGQLGQVYEQELEGFKDKIRAKYGRNPLPMLSYIVVNKRINTKFFEPIGGKERYTNPKPGLIVDDIVTRPERYDFFLISQTARQGCVGPTYYNVLLDQSGLTPDRLQLMTYKLCHLYFNWSGTVSVPGPCQNAHKLAFLVGTALRRPASDNLAYLLHFL